MLLKIIYYSIYFVSIPLSFSYYLKLSSISKRKLISNENNKLYQSKFPKSLSKDTKTSIFDGIIKLSTCIFLNSNIIPKANAIGSIYEFKNQNMCIQDIIFNVPDTKRDALLLSETLEQSIKVISDKFEKGSSTTIMAFGPTAYQSPSSFHPGVNSYFEDGGHATVLSLLLLLLLLFIIN